MAAAFLLVCGAALAAPARDWSEWMSRYYEAPQPEQVVPAAFALSKQGYFNEAAQRTASIGFFATVFAQNPARVPAWMASFRDLPKADQRLMAAALWYSGLPGGGEQLRTLARHSEPSLRAEINQLASRPPVSLLDTPVQSQASLNLQWGAFLASGEQQHIVNVLSALGSGEPALSGSARYTLAQQAASHRRVYEICQAQLDRQPAEVRDQLHAVLGQAQPGGRL